MLLDIRYAINIHIYTIIHTSMCAFIYVETHIVYQRDEFTLCVCCENSHIYIYIYIYINMCVNTFLPGLFVHILFVLTHWRRVTHICVSELTIIGSDNGLSPQRRQAVIWTNAGILIIGPLGTNFSEILIEIQTFSLNKVHLKMSSAKWHPFCLGLNVLNDIYLFIVQRVSRLLFYFWVIERTGTHASITLSVNWLCYTSNN